MVARTRAAEVGEVNGCRDADSSCATAVQMTQLVGEHLELVSAEARLIVQNTVVTWAAGSLKEGNDLKVKFNTQLAYGSKSRACCMCWSRSIVCAL